MDGEDFVGGMKAWEWDPYVVDNLQKEKRNRRGEEEAKRMGGVLKKGDLYMLNQAVKGAGEERRVQEEWYYRDITWEKMWYGL